MDIHILISTRCFFLDTSGVKKTVIIPFPYLQITNKVDLRLKVFYTPEIIEQIGKIFAFGDSYRYDFGYFIGELTDYTEGDTDEILKGKVYLQLKSALKFFEEFLAYLWFAKDCCTCTNLALGYIPNKIDTLFTFSSNRIASMCDANYQDVYFSEEDVYHTILIMDKIFEICPKTPPDTEGVPEFDENNRFKSGILKAVKDHTDHHSLNRIQRALSLLSTLRGTSYLPYKVALYIPIFESLFSGSPGELTFKVSERVAFYMGKDPEDRRRIFKDIGDAYNIRSRYLHGQAFDKKAKKTDLIELSKKMDSLLRLVLTKIILEDSDKFLGEEIETYLSDLVFQANTIIANPST